MLGSVCAGSKLRAYYCSKENLSDCGVGGWRDVAHCGLFNRQGASLHFLRRWHVRCTPPSDALKQGITVEGNS